MSKDQFIDSVDRIAEQYANGELIYGQAYVALKHIGCHTEDAKAQIAKWDLENAPATEQLLDVE